MSDTQMSGFEKKIDITVVVDEGDIRTAARKLSDLGYRPLAIRTFAGARVEVDAYFGAVDIFDALNRLEDDGLYESVNRIAIAGYLNTKKKVSGVA